METYENILEHKSSEKFIQARDFHDFAFIRGLLKKRPSRRLGSRGGRGYTLSSFLRHSEFEELKSKFASTFLTLWRVKCKRCQ